MKDEFLKPLPPDDIKRSADGKFTVSAFVYTTEQGIQEIGIDFKPAKPLDPFYYNKPNLEIPPKFIKDEKPRTSVFPVAIVRNSRRTPNHLYETDNAIIAAVNSGTDETPKWETRYFPKNCIDEETWKQALDILGIKE